MFDTYGRDIHYLRLSVTDFCNLRCRYCMPDGVPKLAHDDILQYEEFLRLVRIFAQNGVDTVRVTGGEPLVRRDVAGFIAQLKAVQGIRKVTLTTNGVLLAQHLPALVAAGLDSINISLDTLQPARFAQITGFDAFDAVWQGVQAAIAQGIPLKINVVPQLGINEDEFEALAALAVHDNVQVRFIEMMPIGYGAQMPCIGNPEILARLQAKFPTLAPISVEHGQGSALGDGPAVYYAAPDWQGHVGFISAVHGKFCSSCNRVRLTSQGFLRSCLASESGADLRDLLRGGASDAQLETAIRSAILAKPCEHHFEEATGTPTRGMYRIGG